MLPTCLNSVLIIANRHDRMGRDGAWFSIVRCGRIP